MFNKPMSHPPFSAESFSGPKDSERGAVALITVIVLMAAGLVIVTGMNLLSFSESSTTVLHVRSNRAFYGDDACVEEALYRLYRSSAYTGGTLAIGPVNCTVTVTDPFPSDNPDVRTIAAVATEGPITRRLNATAQLGSVTLSGRNITTLTLTAWQESTQ